MSMSCGSCSIACGDGDVVADAVRVEHLDDVDLGAAGATCRISPAMNVPWPDSASA